MQSTASHSHHYNKQWQNGEDVHTNTTINKTLDICSVN